MTAFAELVATTNFSFLHGASHPSDMIARAIALGHDGIGIADRNTVAGVVRAHVAVREAFDQLAASGLGTLNFKLVVGARLVFADGTTDIIAFPATRHGWGRLTRLLTAGNLRAEKGGCILGLGDLLRHCQDMMLIALPDNSSLVSTPVKGAMLPPFRTDHSLATTLAALTTAAPGRVWLGVTMPRGGADRRRLAGLARCADQAGIPLLATCDALYAEPGNRPLHDVITCIREGVTVQTAGRLLSANAERHLKDAKEMSRLFADRPEAIAETVNLLARIDFTLDQLSYEYPHEPVPDGRDPQDWLEHLVQQAAVERYGRVPDRISAMLDEEFTLIRQLRYAYYFLTVHDIVHFAHTQDPPILCQGRGSAANSAVCFLLGITSVDPMKHDLLFSRFVSAERNEPPDIDVDFEHERREEVMQYIYRRYGRHRAAIAGTVIHYRPRSTVRDAGKALGLTEDVTTRLTSTVWGSFSDQFEEKRFAETGFSLDNPEITRLRDIVDQLLRFPRHLSQHVGGFVLTENRLDETVPIHNAAMDDRTFIEWDKDDIDALGLMKVDVLALGMLTCIRKSFELLRQHQLGDYRLDTIPEDMPEVYDMLCKGDSIGVFQVESRAQINMLPRLKPRCLYDLVIQVAIVRPGPIQGDMVHPYLRRRAGKEAVEFASPSPHYGPPDELEQVLGKTLGVPLFQEQAMKLAIVAAEFSPMDANRLRRAMATFKNVGTMDNFETKMVGGMVRRGYDRHFAERCFKQIEGFGSYGFPESHALSFARLVYVSSWIKCFHPAVFACALLNAQPMGFYAPAQIVRDAREHGVETRAIDVNASAWDNTLELRRDGSLALRLGLRQIDGFREDWANALVEARGEASFDTIESVARRAMLPKRALNLLADADAYCSLSKARREALWEVRRTPASQLPLFAAVEAPELGVEPDPVLPPMPQAEQVAADYQVTRLSLKGHPMAFLRPVFSAENIVSSEQANRLKDGSRAKIAGIVLVRQRPGKGNAIFITLEDETGVTNALLWARDFERNRRAVMAARLMVIEGVIQRSEEGVTHLMATGVTDRSTELQHLTDGSDDLVGLTADATIIPMVSTKSADARYTNSQARHPRDVRVLPRSRDFH